MATNQFGRPPGKINVVNYTPGQIPHHPTGRRSSICLSMGGAAIWLHWSDGNPRRQRIMIRWWQGHPPDAKNMREVLVLPYYYKQAMEQIINVVLLQIEVPLGWLPDLKPSNHKK